MVTGEEVCTSLFALLPILPSLQECCCQAVQRDQVVQDVEVEIWQRVSAIIDSEIVEPGCAAGQAGAAAWKANQFDSC